LPKASSSIAWTPAQIGTNIKMNNKSKPKIELSQFEQERRKEQKERILNIIVDKWTFSNRTKNRLKLAQIETIGQLILKTESELLALKGFGKKSLRDVEEKLYWFEIDGFRLTLREDLPSKLKKKLPLNERQAEDAMHEIACAVGLFQTTKTKSEFYATVLSAVQALKRQQAFSLKREEAVKKAATILSDFANQWKGYAINTQQDWNRFDEISQCLSPAEINVIELRFGRSRRKATTLEHAAKIVGLSKERVRQIQKNAILKLQRHISETEK